MRRVLLAATCLASLAAATPLIAQEKADRVTYVSDHSKTPPVTSSRTGTITVENPGKIVITTGINRTPVDVKAADVVEVKYDGEPEELTTARAAERKREFDKALASYREALKKANPANAFLRTSIDFAIARSLVQLADGGQPELRPQAIEALRKFRQEHPSARQIVECLDHLSRLLMMEGKPTQEVVDAFRQLRSAHADNKEIAQRCDQFESQILLEEAQAALKDSPEEARKKYADAQAKLRAMAEGTDKAAPEVRIGLAECKAVLGNPEEAIQELDALVKETPETDKRLRALLHLGRANCHRLVKNYRAAMWDYLWVDLFYGQDPEHQAKALYYLQEVFEALKDVDGNAEVRARECRERLVSDPRLKDTRYQRLAGK